MNEIEYAISELESLKDICLNPIGINEGSKKLAEIYQMAIDAIKNDRWIPVTERLPEKNKVVLIYVRSMSRGGESYTIGSCSNGCWFTESGVGLLSYPNSNRYEVLAWRPLPESYDPLAEKIQKVLDREYDRITMGKK